MGKVKEKLHIPEENIIMKTVPVPITQDERLSAGDSLAQEELDLAAITAENKSLNAEFRKNKKEVMERIEKFTKMISEGVEERECRTYFKYNVPTKGQKELWAESELSQMWFLVETTDMTVDDENDLFLNGGNDGK